MLSFEFCSPTKIYFGKDMELACAKAVKENGATRVLVHFGGNSAIRSGLLERVFNSLKESGIEYFEFGGVVPNPRLSLVYKGIELCREKSVDFILAVGGGSVIDSAKAIACGVHYAGDVWDFYSGKAQAKEILPIGTILTLAAAGSETSCNSVITKEDGMLKRGYGNELMRPRFSILNPSLTATLPPYQTACGAVDIIMHTTERYFSHTKNVELSDRFCEAIIKTVINNAKILMDDPNNYNARAEVMWAGALAHNNLTGACREQDWATHQLEHELSGLFDVAHGAGLAAIWPSWARYVADAYPMKFAQFAVNAMGEQMNFEDINTTIDAGIKAMERFFKDIGMPTRINQMGINLTEEQIELMAEKCSFNESRTIGGLKNLVKNDMINIYRMAQK